MDNNKYNYFLREIKNYNLRLGCIPPEYRTYELCFEAVKQNGLALRFVKNKTDEICTAAIKQNPEAIKYIDNIEQNAYIEAVANKIKELHKYIKDNDQLIELEETLIRMILTMKK